MNGDSTLVSMSSQSSTNAITQMRVALAQVNPKLGAIASNVELVVENVRKAQGQGAHLVLFPEMVITGYPVEDLSHRKTLREASSRAVREIASLLAREGMGEIAVLVGYLDSSIEGDRALNAAAILHRGEVKGRYIKRHLPNYGVFDEYRNFEAGTNSLVFRHCGVDIAIAICEDIWRDGEAMTEIASRSPGLVAVINGSPYERNKDDVRLALVQKRAMQIGAPLCYVNMVGGQDDLVFDGDSIVVDAAGRVIARAPQFEEGVMVVDLDLRACSSSTALGQPDLIVTDGPLPPYGKLVPGVAVRLGPEAEVWSALVMGVRDYVMKNGFTSALLGLSGGIDSALVATLAVDALGAENVYGVSLPSKYSSQHSLEDAKQLAINLGLNYSVIPIQPMVDAFLNATTLTGVAEENVQARVRGTTLMGISNQQGQLVLATGNKSELAVGYSTLYGDAVGGFAPIKDIFKSDVWRLAKWRNEFAISEGQQPPIPVNSIEKEPSAELRPGQRDSDSLPSYPILDQILTIYIEANGSIDAIVAAGFSKELALRVITMVDRAEYKRRQYPPGTKVSNLAFGKDRRLPLTSLWRELT